MLLLLLPSDNAEASRQTNSQSLTVGQRYDVAIPDSNHPLSNPSALKINSLTQAKPVTAEVAEQTLIEEKTPALTWQTVKVKSGDSLAKILNRLGFSAQTTYQISKAKGEYSKKVLNLDVGDTLKFGSDSDGQLAKIEYPLSKTKTLFIDKTESGFVTSSLEKEVEYRTGYANGKIDSNFWLSATEAGLTDGQIMQLADKIFSWDIDFALDVRKGDTFHIVYQDKYVDGEYVGKGDILSAEFVNQNDVFQAVRFTDGNYYTPKGDSLRKAFLRAPVNFRYISSNFQKRRFHPISKKWKAHRGTDYRAATGTPVYASGDGKVTHSTYNRFNGHYVFIQHAGGIVTKYLHFSKRAVKKGQRVKQGQVIGYVGSTGQSQAPHLHYEFLLNGVHRDPRTVKLPDAKPIASKYKKEFLALADRRLAELNSSKNAYLAMQRYDE